MKLDTKIDVMREKLNKVVEIKGLADSNTLKISEKLDALIVIKTRRMMA